MKILVFDIGGSHTRYGILDHHKIITQNQVVTPQESRIALIDLLMNLYREHQDVKGIAVSMPGIIDPRKGYCVMGGALRYNDDFYIQEALEERTGLPVIVENNAKCAALAEALEGSLKDVADGMALFFDRMIGSGLIRDHRLVRGPHFATGEVAYIITVRNDMPDFDTLWGHRCSLLRLCTMYERVKRLPAHTVTFADVMEAVQQGDFDAAACLDSFAKEIAVQIFNLQSILDVSRFAIGGKAGRYEIFVEAIRTNLSELYAICPYDIPSADIVNCVFKDEASLIGAALNYELCLEGEVR